jgi:hypothetical protein
METNFALYRTLEQALHVSAINEGNLYKSG